MGEGLFLFLRSYRNNTSKTDVTPWMDESLQIDGRRVNENVRGETG